MQRTEQEIDALLDKLQSAYPVPSPRSKLLEECLNAQVVIPYSRGEISESIAEFRWVENLKEDRLRASGQTPLPSPSAPANESSQEPTKSSPEPDSAAHADVIMPETESPGEFSETAPTLPLNAESEEAAASQEAAADVKSSEASEQTIPLDKVKSEDEATDAPQPAPPPLNLGQVPTDAHQTQSGEVLEEQAGTPVPPPPPPKPFIKPEWKVLEPEDQTDPVDHEVSETIQRNEQWKIAAASVRGRLHAHKALWRDDAYAVGKVDDWTILVVSDGAGSAPLARIGARACADAARDKLTELLDGFVPSSFAADPSDTSDLGRVKTFLCEAGRASLYAVQREAQQRERQLRDFHATLLVMVHLPLGDRDLVAALQVGDGAVGIYTQDGNCTLLGIADHGEYSSETRFITTPNIEREFGARVLFAAKESVVALAAMCDGISDDFFPEDKRLVELFAGGEIEGMKFANGDSVDGLLYTVAKEEDSGKALLEWMKYEKKGSSDDRTLLLMYRPDLVEKV